MIHFQRIKKARCRLLTPELRLEVVEIERLFLTWLRMVLEHNTVDCWLRWVTTIWILRTKSFHDLEVHPLHKSKLNLMKYTSSNLSNGNQGTSA